MGFALTSATGKTELTGKVRIAGEELSLKGSYEHRYRRCIFVVCQPSFTLRALGLSPILPRHHPPTEYPTPST